MRGSLPSKPSKTFTQDEVNALIQKRVGEVNAKNEERNKQVIQDALADYDCKQKKTTINSLLGWILLLLERLLKNVGN